MSYLLQMPMKFECGHCHQMYLHTYQYTDHHCPECPTVEIKDCSWAWLNGMICYNTRSFLLKSYLRQTWHMLKQTTLMIPAIKPNTVATLNFSLKMMRPATTPKTTTKIFMPAKRLQVCL